MREERERTELGDRHLVQQVASKDGNLLFGGVMLTLVSQFLILIRSPDYLNRRTLSPFPAEAGHLRFDVTASFARLHEIAACHSLK